MAVRAVERFTCEIGLWAVNSRNRYGRFLEHISRFRAAGPGEARLTPKIDLGVRAGCSAMIFMRSSSEKDRFYMPLEEVVGDIARDCSLAVAHSF